jgi:anti-sigma regulatory factor (Ser/Thr protein kinase)
MRRFTTPSEGEMISPINSGTGTVPGPGAPGSLESGSGAGPACHWPLRAYLELAPLASAVPCARLHARLVLGGEWGLLPVDTAELIVSELVTNAVQASAGLTGSRYDGRWTPGTPPVRVWLCSDRQRVVAAVWDGSDRMPARTMPDDPEAERGRGLLLVETLSAEWGVHTPARSSGKVVWAVLTQ